MTVVSATQIRQPRALASEPSSHAIDTPYLNAEQAAGYLLYTSVGALYKAISHGTTNSLGQRIPLLRRGRTMLFDRGALDAWLHAEQSPRLVVAAKGHGSSR